MSFEENGLMVSLKYALEDLHCSDSCFCSAVHAAVVMLQMQHEKCCYTTCLLSSLNIFH